MANQPDRTSSTAGVPLVSAFLLALGLMLGFVLRTYCLGCQSLWFDEGFSAWVARLGFSAGLDYVVRWDAHPPLYYWMLTAWRWVAGPSELSLRFPSAVFGVLLLPVIYQIAKQLEGRRLGVIAVLLAAVAPILVYHSQQARMYAAATFLSTLAAYWLISAWRDGGRWKSVGLFAVTSGLSMLTLYYAAFALLGQLAVLAWACLRARGRGSVYYVHLIRRLGVSAVAVIIVLSAWIPALLNQAAALAPGAWRTLVPLPEVLIRSVGTFTLGQTASGADGPWVWLAGGVGFVLLLLGLRHTRSSHSRAPDALWRLASAGRLWMGFVALPVLLIGLGSYVRPIYDGRYLVVLYPAVALALARGFSVAWRLQAGIAVIGAAVLLGGESFSLYNLYHGERYALDDYRLAVRDMQQGLAPGDTVLLSSGANFPTVANYLTLPIRWKGQLQNYEAEALPRLDDLENGITLVQVGTIGVGQSLITPEDAPLSIDEAMDGLRAIARTSARVWFFRMYDTISDRQALVRTWLDSEMLMADERYYRGPSYLQLYLFVPKDPGVLLPRIQHGADLHFANGATLRGFSVRGGDPAPGGSLPLTLYWSADRPIAADYQIFVHLDSRSGKTVAQVDGPPLGGHYPTSRWGQRDLIPESRVLSVPADAPPGRYTVRVGLYDLRTIDRVRLEGGEDAASLGPVVVRPRQSDLSGVQTDMATDIEGGMRLLGSRVDGHLAAQPGLDVTVYWGCSARPAGDYTVYVHVVDDAGRVVAQSDGEPVGGNFPTSLCLPGETIEDAHTVVAPSDLSTGNYQILVGLYDRQTGRRLRTLDGRDAIAVGRPR